MQAPNLDSEKLWKKRSIINLDDYDLGTICKRFKLIIRSLVHPQTNLPSQQSLDRM